MYTRDACEPGSQLGSGNALRVHKPGSDRSVPVPESFPTLGAVPFEPGAGGS
jgi:hypothetical protein